MVYDLIVRMVGGMGYKPITRSDEGFGHLPIIRNENGEELYRGEFKETAEDALQACLDRLVQSPDWAKEICD